MSQRAFATAAVIVFIALTPSWSDAVQLSDRSDREYSHDWRLPLLLWYAALAFIACQYWAILK